MINHPLVRIFTTFILCCLLITPLMDGFFKYYDNFVKVVYWIVAIYVLLKKIYDVWKSTKS